MREPDGWVDGVALFDQQVPEEYRDVVVLFGDCPRCNHRMEVDLPVKQRTGKRLQTADADSETLPKPFAKTASCNCRAAHQGRPEDLVQGCGAFGRLEVGREGAPSGGIVRVEGKPFAATLADLEWERKAERLGIEELTSVRTTGEKWTATVSSITGIFGVVALIKGPEDVSKLEGFWEAIAIASVLVAVALALIGVLFAAFAAYGMPRWLRPLGGSLRREQSREAAKARRFLAGSVAAAIGAVAALAVAIAVTWGATPEETPPKQGKVPAARAVVLTEKDLKTFRGLVSIRRAVPAGQKNDRLCLLRYEERKFERAAPTGGYWTSCDEQNLRTLAAVRRRLALTPRFKPLLDLRLRAEIPEGTKVIYAEGTVGPQCAHRVAEPPCKRSRRYPGGATQYFFPDKKSPSKWIRERACMASSENKRGSRHRCS